ncbi:MAG TPA: serine/threonine-protein kinase [Kofleriaceae bacterium]|nr:serine/threonine-protein kinase [Kofleriaceae bacterium]
MAPTMAPPSRAATRNPAAESATDATMAAPTSTERRRAQVDSFQDTVATGGAGAGAAAATGVDDLPLADPAQYIAEREVARGGMGRIIAAHDRHLGRPVALKELLHADAEQATRFRREALITARLQHPAIVPVYQAGRWPSGEPFYAMKLVSGRPLDRVIADATTLTSRLALLPSIIAAVDAIAYAHSRRVVHRDLKPANVLVGDFGEIVVIDWGLAKDLDAPTEDDVATAPPTKKAPSENLATGSSSKRTRPGGGGSESASLTVAGAVMGTPAYMPPEQARGDSVDERADVFSLGAMLYHTLAGAPPYTARTATDVIAHAIAGKVVPLSERKTGAPQDLVAIVERAMAHEPADRYPTAQALAEELRRFQTGQLVAAHDYSLRERLARFVRRHRAAVTVTAIAVLAFAILGTLAVRRIVVERDRATAQRVLAERRRAAAEGMVDFMVSDLRTRLGAIGRKDLLAGMGAQIRDYYRRVAELPGGMTADDTQRMALALLTLGQAESERGDQAAALATLGDGRTRLEALVAQAPDRSRRQLLAELIVEIGRVQHARGEYTAEVDTYRAALVHYDALLVGDPDDRAALLGGAAARDQIGDITRNLARLDEASREYSQAMAARKRLVDASGGKDEEAVAALSTSHLKLASSFQARGDTRRALEEYQETEKLRAGLAAADPENSGRQLDLARARTQVADIERELGRFDSSFATYEKALAIIDGLLRKDPGNALWRRERGIIFSNWGYAKLEPGEVDEAIRLLDQGLANHSALVQKDPTNTSWLIDLSRLHFRLGDAHVWKGDLSRALAQYVAARTIREQLLARDPKSPLWRRLVAWSDSKISYAHWIGGDLAKSRVAGDSALDLRTQLHDESPDQALVRNELALSEIQLGRIHLRAAELDLGEARADRGIALVDKLVADDPINVEWKETLVSGLLVRAELRLAAGKRDAAIADCTRAEAEATLALTAAPNSAVWPELRAEARWLRSRAATDRAAAADDVAAAFTEIDALARAGRLGADKRPVLDRIRAAHRR